MCKCANEVLETRGNKGKAGKGKEKKKEVNTSQREKSKNGR